MCWLHDPARAGQRSRHASRAARSKGNRELLDVKARLRQLVGGVLDGRVNKGVGAVVSTIWGVYLRAVSTELAVKEQLELVERLEMLEEALEQKGIRYGA